MHARIHPSMQSVSGKGVNIDGQLFGTGIGKGLGRTPAFAIPEGNHLLGRVNDLKITQDSGAVTITGYNPARTRLA